MHTASKQKTRLTIEDALLFVFLWGGAWALGFLLGFG